MTPPPVHVHVRELWEVLDLVEEILVRIPPDEPACLIRASLACKPWCRLLSSHAFRKRYRTLHRTPPLLGLLQCFDDDLRHPFVPTANFWPRNTERRDHAMLDCRHGRVLLVCELKVGEGDKDCRDMVVWDPVSGSRAELPDPDFVSADCSFAVLCPVDGCSHICCNTGPFLVALICLDDGAVHYGTGDDEEDRKLVSVSVYSSRSREWATRASVDITAGLDGPSLVERPGVVVGQELYFLLINRDQHLGILRYHLGNHSLSLIDLPEGVRECTYNPLLIPAANDGGLGVVHLDQHGLCTVWSTKLSLDGVASCIKLKEIDLKMLLPIGNPTDAPGPKAPLGYVEGTDIILVTTNLGVFTIDIKSLVSRKLSSKPRLDTQFMLSYSYLEGTYNIFPYMSFSNPPAVAGVVSEARASGAGSGDPEI